MTRRDYFIRLAISVVIDLFDLVIGWIPGFGTVTDGLGAVILFMLWGKPGLAYLWEVVDIVDQTDALVPTATLIALYVGWRNGMLLGRPRPDSQEVTPS